MPERLVYLGYAAAWAITRRLPEAVCAPVFRLIADIAWRRRGRGVLRLEANLRRVLGAQATPERLAALSRAGMRSYLRYWLQFFQLPAYSGERIDRRFHVGGMEHLAAAREAGRGVVLVLGHCGNWDLAGAWLARAGYPFTTVAERLRPERLFDRFVAYRQALGMEVLPLTGGDRAAFGVLAQRLRAGGVVCLVGDRDLTSGGVVVDFFGEPASLPAGPATLALHTGAALLPATLWYEPDGKGRAEIHPPIAVPAAGGRAERARAMTQAVADALARGVAAHPEDWHMLQRLWLADLDPARRAAVLARQVGADAGRPGGEAAGTSAAEPAAGEPRPS